MNTEDIPRDRIVNVGLIGHPNVGVTTLQNQIAKLDETPAKNLFDQNAEIIFIDIDWPKNGTS